MKITAIILAALISFLAIKPGIEGVFSIFIDTEIHCCDKRCTPLADKGSDEQQGQKNDCEGKKCNPFQVCSSCVLLVIQVIPFDGFLKLKTATKTSFAYQSSFASPHISDIWHPPEVV
jgi:hypothetical protein